MMHKGMLWIAAAALTGSLALTDASLCARFGNAGVHG
jgi:hypothetical protein